MRIGGDAVRIVIVVAIMLAAIFPWLFFASLQDEEIDMLTQEELEEFVNELWEKNEDDES